MSRHIRVLLPALAAALLCSTAAKAATIVNLSVERGGWWTTNTSVIGEDWLAGAYSIGQGFPAQAGYYQGGDPAPNNTIWYCGGPEDCHVNPTPISYFVNAKTIPNLKNAGDTQMIAKDYMELWVNGVLIFNALLETNKSTIGDPTPLTVRIDANDVYLLNGIPIYQAPIDNNVLFAGLNVFAIKAMDGSYGSDCGAGTVDIPGTTNCFKPEAGNEGDLPYLYVYTPEPATLALFGVGGLLMLLRRRKVI